MLFELVLFFGMASTERSMNMTPSMPVLMNQKFQTEAECRKIAKSLVDLKMPDGPMRAVCVPVDAASIAAVGTRLETERKAAPVQKNADKNEPDKSDEPSIDDLYRNDPGNKSPDLKILDLKKPD